MRHRARSQIAEMESQRRVSGATSLSASSGYSSITAQQFNISSSEWNEPKIAEFCPTLDADEQSLQLGCDHGPRRRFSISFRNRQPQQYDSVGLSPDCRLAFMLSEEMVEIFYLTDRPKVEAEKRGKISGVFKDAVLSNNRLAVLERYNLRVFELCKNQSNLPRGELLSSPLSVSFETPDRRDGWIPKCLSIYDDNRGTWVAVGGSVKTNAGFAGDIKVFFINGGEVEELGRSDAGFRQTILIPLKTDTIRTISFSADGARLACTTNNNKVLVWTWSPNLGSWEPPFQIRRTFSPQADPYRQGMIKSATLFTSPSQKPYVLCTTSPSAERELNKENGGEWSFISPVDPGSTTIPNSLSHRIEQLLGSVVAGAVASFGDVLAVVESTGAIRLLRLNRQLDGGLCCQDFYEPVAKIEASLFKQHTAGPTSLRFQESIDGLRLFAIDDHGKVIIKRLTRNPYPPVLPPSLLHVAEIHTEDAELPGQDRIYRHELNTSPMS